ncbi:MAG: hypothetical protein C3F02_00890 [Parcubacteria group bacterium]|nr:MAG: hypothetical protein C3F02_00890 [Parcubacteria group bacterium]
MNIGVDIRALSSAKLSGVGNYIWGALQNILALDHKNQYYLFSSGWKSEKFDWLSFSQANVHHIHLQLWNKLINLSMLSPWPVDIIDKIPAKLDLFWLPNIDFFQTKSDIPLLLTFHDLSFISAPHFFNLQMKFWHLAVRPRKLVTRATEILAVSENTKRDLVKFFSTEGDKVKVLKPGLSVVPLTAEQAEVIARQRNWPQKFFLFIGTLEPRKNLSAVIQAFEIFSSKFPDYHLLIAGQPGWLYGPLLRQIKKRSQIHYLRHVSEPEKSALYRHCRALVWPSFYEGYGFPPLEALYFHKPVITSYKTAMPENLKNMVIYIDPYNINDIYQAMMMLADDRRLSVELEKGSGAASISSWDGFTRQILEVFKEMDLHENSH